MIKELYEYFAANWKREPFPVIDHSLRIDRKPDGSFHFYIHPSNTSGITTDFNLTADKLELEDFGFHGIGWAIKQMQNGAKVARIGWAIKTNIGWNGKGMFLYYVPASTYKTQTDVARKTFGDSVPYQAYIACAVLMGSVVPWVASQTDLLATDWVVVE